MLLQLWERPVTVFDASVLNRYNLYDGIIWQLIKDKTDKIVRKEEKHKLSHLTRFLLEIEKRKLKPR